MTATSPITIEQAELLHDLVQRLLAGQRLTLEQRKDATILVGLLIGRSNTREVEVTMSHLERKLWDDTAP